MKCTVKQRGKFFIVVDPFNHNSYTLNNKLQAEKLCDTLNESADFKKALSELVGSILSSNLKSVSDSMGNLNKSCNRLGESLEVLKEFSE